MRPLHHVGYWVDDLDDGGRPRRRGTLGVGPFLVHPHVRFDSFTLADGTRDRRPGVLRPHRGVRLLGPDRAGARREVHTRRPRPRRGVRHPAPATVGHVSWVVDDLAAETRAARGPRLPADPHRVARGGQRRLARRRPAVPAPDRGPPRGRADPRDARPARRPGRRLGRHRPAATDGTAPVDDQHGRNPDARLLGLSCGTPGGSAEIVLKEALRAAEAEGAEVELVRLDELRPAQRPGPARARTTPGGSGSG